MPRNDPRCNWESCTAHFNGVEWYWPGSGPARTEYRGRLGAHTHRSDHPVLKLRDVKVQGLTLRVSQWRRIIDILTAEELSAHPNEAALQDRDEIRSYLEQYLSTSNRGWVRSHHAKCLNPPEGCGEYTSQWNGRGPAVIHHAPDCPIAKAERTFDMLAKDDPPKF